MLEHSGYRNKTPDHAVTGEESLLTWTRHAAEVFHWDDLGTLNPGKQADLVVVDRNPLTCALDALSHTRARLTVVGGHVVHQIHDLKPS